MFLLYNNKPCKRCGSLHISPYFKYERNVRDLIHVFKHNMFNCMIEKYELVQVITKQNHYIILFQHPL
jgi:hypothetical protein